MDNAHPYLVPPQEARELELSGGVRSLPQVPLVERRQASAPEAEGRREPPSPWRAPCAVCARAVEYRVCRRSASFLLFVRHCEERSDEAIQNLSAALDCFASLATTPFDIAV
jgi:hypothetical protein